MYYFLAIYNGNQTEIKIITENSSIDNKKLSIKNNYVKSLADEIINLSHQNNLFHNDIKRIGLKIEEPGLIGYETVETLKTDLETKFGFEAIINNDYEKLLEQLIK
ncbi:hypothetical protein [Staphylococcus gallinarum]|uniref:hypothetical protein n=1 Tax=Staphylococcus gallinarum TaxID=1293 RepID=UPI000D1EEA8A|nr:hypothetical protein [Staphylococcus gallinarum]PTK89539.1 hypothetical protein BUZ05_11705 [Staphylococcus gallinarum]PTK92618.1 hypothetical protein BUZ13_07910 [Staphylococcus gallinarum]RIO86096.1 hypothetical protein BUZ06_13620 [Staphylococcus gallinarum]